MQLALRNAIVLGFAVTATGCFASYQKRADDFHDSGDYAEALVNYDAAKKRGETLTPAQSRRRKESCEALIGAAIQRADKLIASGHPDSGAGSLSEIKKRAQEWGCPEAIADEKIAETRRTAVRAELTERLERARAKLAANPLESLSACLEVQKLAEGERAYAPRDSAEALELEGLAKAAAQGAQAAGETMASRERESAQAELASGKPLAALRRLAGLLAVAKEWALGPAAVDAVNADLDRAARAAWKQVEALDAPATYPRAIDLASQIAEPLPSDHELHAARRALLTRAAKYHAEQALRLKAYPDAVLLHHLLAVAWDRNEAAVLPVQQPGTRGRWTFARAKAPSQQPRVLDQRSYDPAKKVTGPWFTYEEGCDYYNDWVARRLGSAGESDLDIDLRLDACASEARFQMKTDVTYDNGPYLLRKHDGIITETTTGTATTTLKGTLTVVVPRTGAQLRRSVQIEAKFSEVVDNTREEMVQAARDRAIESLAAQVEQMARELLATDLKAAQSKFAALARSNDEERREAAHAGLVRASYAVSPESARFFGERYGLTEAEISQVLLRGGLGEPARLWPTSQPTPWHGDEKLEFRADKGTLSEDLILPDVEPLSATSIEALYMSSLAVSMGVELSPFDGAPSTAAHLLLGDDYYSGLSAHVELPLPGGWGFGGELNLPMRTSSWTKYCRPNLGFAYRQHKSDSGRRLRELGLTVGVQVALAAWLELDVSARPNLLYATDKLFGAGDVVHPSMPLEAGATLLFGNVYLRASAAKVPQTDLERTVLATVGWRWDQ